jgi:F-type H+-transporting ATPase subunit gamma
MSDTTASLGRQIASAGDLQSVVRTMKALAAASIGQYEQAVSALADYTQSVELGLGVCFRQHSSATWMPERTGYTRANVIGAVVFGSDQGLVGQFNEVVADYALQALAAMGGRDQQVYAVGTRLHARLVDAGLRPIKLFAVPNSVQTIAPLAGTILVDSAGQSGMASVTELHLFYNRRTVGGAHAHAPFTQRLLPLDEPWRRKLTGLMWPTSRLPEVLGGTRATTRALIGEHLFISLFQACAESLVSENASRLAAMQRADKNIDELLEQLHGTFHRARQSGIDEELFDVVSGFEALRKPSS